MDLLKSHYSGKRVLLTGHTGFKGAWMAEWLLDLGAEVVGVSLEPNTSPSLFEQLNLANRMEHHIADIREADRLHAIVQEAQPDIVFHLAAQPLVRYSYEQPVETFASNVMGTVHLLEALRFLDKRCQAVFITTDKCYENLEQRRPYSEEDRMGGMILIVPARVQPNWSLHRIDGHFSSLQSMETVIRSHWLPLVPAMLLGVVTGLWIVFYRIVCALLQWRSQFLFAINTQHARGNMSWSRLAVICYWD